MVDWSRKFGYVIPSWNTVIEYETTRMLPPGTSAHFARIAHTDDSRQSLEYMSEHFPDSADLLHHAKVDAICYACTAASFLRGPHVDREFMAATSTRLGVPTISMAGAIADAAGRLGCKRLSVAAPYEEWLLDLLVRYLAEVGFTVDSAVGLGQQANILHTPEMAIELARRAWTPGSDGLVLSCSNFRTLEVIPEIERMFGVPVFTSNNAAVWALLSAGGWQGTLSDCGRILSAPV